jgi:Gram-negative bacterial TonB protein C-terminal
MIPRFVSVFGIACLLCGCAIGQAQTEAPWPCQAEIHKADPKAFFIRVSDRVTNQMADTKIMPDISDLKGKDVDSLVIVQILFGPDGVVRCSRLQEGDADLAQRSLDAAQKWHYRPYILDGQAINVETWIRFSYKKDSVDVVLPDR